ncbi:bifunctional GroEL-like equatorial domain superfamily/Chaperone tailless complex polypeptide 1 (TCP-1)/Chaperonin TCP-1 [Babesia duncani]|uniref:CCT-theta n=1 Tax=Babesia duncani TaxID=323732 RepID=A0AAD9UQ81_9APIC|nr:bifunctional GroEL-like equatorial domain superfamily/Chaperone tailless complex polypeptide 1 (TCP-1)/Chaperonin TCP-1 [Babesia duncani]
MFAQKFGTRALLRDGSRAFGPNDNAALRNIEACTVVCDMLKTSLGPNSMKKLIVDRLEKRFVTCDCETILNGLDVQHPAAKILVMAVETMQQEFGDGTNTLIGLAGELLSNASLLLLEGLHISDVRRGYEIAYNRVMETLKDEIVWTISNYNSETELVKAIRTSVCTKLQSNEVEICNLIAKAAVMVMPPKPNAFDVESIRVCKIIGGNVSQSSVINGMVVLRDASGVVKSTGHTKVMVLNCGLEFVSTEAKGTVLINNADELMNFTSDEEDRMEQMIRKIKDLGVGCIIANVVSEIALHYCNKYQIFVLKIVSKFEMQRLCKTLRAVPLVKFSVPSLDDLGVVESIKTTELSSQRAIIINACEHAIATIILKGPTMGILDEIERAIDDGFNCVSASIRDPSFLSGGGAVEIAMAKRLTALASGISGLEHYAIERFAQSFEYVPKILATNAGHDAIVTVTELYAAHEAGNSHACVNINEDSKITDAHQVGVLDHYGCKMHAIKLAYEAAMAILSVDQIIMSKPAGGPKPKAPGPPDL